jgi:hypothetical protein
MSHPAHQGNDVGYNQTSKKTSLMSKWNHHCCDFCWIQREPDRDPVRMRPQFVEDEACCFCGQSTKSGIFVREDPAKALCQGKHEDDD